MPFIQTQSQADYFRRRTIYHNNNLSLALDKLDYNPRKTSLYLFDIYSLILNLTTSNSTNALKAKNCWEVTNGNVTVLCPNPDLYAYIDQNHFSARMHYLIGCAVRQFLTNSSTIMKSSFSFYIILCISVFLHWI